MAIDFTIGIQQILVFAQEEAYRLKNDYTGIEHIVVCLFMQKDRIVTSVLRDLNIDSAMVRAGLEKLLQIGDKTLPLGEIPFNLPVKKALQNAVTESKKLGQTYVGQEHLLLAILGLEDETTTKVLKDFGLNMNVLEEVIIAIPKDEKDNLNIYQTTPLHLAIDNINMVKVKELLAARADLYTRNEKGEIPLEYAMNKRFEEMDFFYFDKGDDSTPSDFFKEKMDALQAIVKILEDAHIKSENTQPEYKFNKNGICRTVRKIN